MTRADFVLALLGLTMAAWLLSVLWVRRAPTTRAGLRRAASSFVIPILGVAASAALLQGVKAWPHMVAIGVAAGLVLAARRTVSGS